MQICLHKDMTFIDFVFTKSKVKVTRFTFVKKVKIFLPNILETIAIKPLCCTCLFALDLTTIYFVLTRSKVNDPVCTFLICKRFHLKY